MATSATTPGVEQAPKQRRPLLRRTQRAVPSAVWYALAAFGFAVLVVFFQLALYLRRSEPRDLRVILERELRLNTLNAGERVVRTVPVFRRAAADYFRATRGLLVLTNRRLIYLGVPPRDITGASDVPPAFHQKEFAYDTLTQLDPSFALLGFGRALTVESPSEDLELAIAPGYWQRARLMQAAWDARRRKLFGIGVWASRVRDARAQLDSMLQEYKRQPVYHVVRPGDAISSISSWYETSPEKIRELNGLPGDRIKVGQRLLIRPGQSGAGTAGATGATGAGTTN